MGGIAEHRRWGFPPPLTPPHKGEGDLAVFLEVASAKIRVGEAATEGAGIAHQVLGAIGAALEPFQFDTVYSHFFDRFIPTGAKQILQASIERHVAAVGGAYDRT